MCSSLKFISEARLSVSLIYFYLVYNHKIFGSETPKKFQNHETVRGGCIPSKNKFKTQKAWVKVARFSYKFQTATYWVSYR